MRFLRFIRWKISAAIYTLLIAFAGVDNMMRLNINFGIFILEERLRKFGGLSAPITGTYGEIDVVGRQKDGEIKYDA